VLELPGCERDLLDKRPDVFPDDDAWRLHLSKLFVVIFGRGAFLPNHRGETFHQLALRQGKQWEAQVARDLSNTVFGQVFPELCRALAAADGKATSALDGAYLDELREGALSLLYRLLFVLYAEDRNLLPDETGPYADYSLTRLRLEVADRRSKGDRLSDRMKAYWSRLDGIFQAIGQGDNGLGIPPYNGGLFDPSAAPTDRVLDAMAEAAATVTFAAYVSPLAARIETIRGRILAEARAHDWPIAEAQLDDRHIVRRMVLKRVVYGIDKNSMAVELAKVALWLHSFTVGAPLSFLNHHLRWGNSVLGAWVRPSVDALSARGAMFNSGVIAGVERVAKLMAEIEQTTDNDISEVAESKAKFGEIEEETRPIGALFSLLTAEKLKGVFDAAPKKAPLSAEKMEGKSEAQLARWRADVKAFEAASALQLALEGTFGDPIKIAAGEIQIAPPDLALQIALLPEDHNEAEPQLFPHIAVNDRRRALADRLVREAPARAAHHRFFHWEIGFPNVWSNLLSGSPLGASMQSSATRPMSGRSSWVTRSSAR